MNEMLCSHPHHPVEAHLSVNDPVRHSQKKALILCLWITGITMLIEFLAGWVLGSLMLVSDGLHMFSHLLALGVSYLGFVISQIKPKPEYSFGLYRIEIFAAFFNAVTILLFSLFIFYEAFLKFLNPTPFNPYLFLPVAILGLIVNLSTAYILHRSEGKDLNTRSAFIHLLSDTLSSGGIIIGGLVLLFKPWYWIDPLVSLLIAGVILRWGFLLLRDSVSILLERTPRQISLSQLTQSLIEYFPQIKSVHDIHMWEITSQFRCATMHIAVDDCRLSQLENLKEKISRFLSEKFGIVHLVIQFEPSQKSGDF